jgi:hypothetical protein
MPSPFPGMDPYLESPDVFPNLHDRMITYLEDTLQPLLPEPYYAKSNQRVWIESDESRLPDVSVVHSGHDEHGNEGGVVVGTRKEALPIQITVARLERHEFRESYLEIYTKQGGERRLVTAIEILSPRNKRADDEARGEYRLKQGEFAAGKVNLVEIDLLRSGSHTTAVPYKAFRKKCGPCDYHVSVHRFDRPKDFFVYPIQLESRLPSIFIPLLPDASPISLDLQAIFDQCYDAGPYRREINYAQDPPAPPLSEERLAWVKQILSAKAGAR